MSQYANSAPKKITAKRAQYEIEVNHSLVDGFQDFIADHGTHAEYLSKDLFNWLGY